MKKRPGMQGAEPRQLPPRRTVKQRGGVGMGSVVQRPQLVAGGPGHIVGRHADPRRLVQGYHMAASTLNLIRAFTQGGFADLREVHSWNRGFASNPANNPLARKVAGRRWRPSASTQGTTGTSGSCRRTAPRSRSCTTGSAGCGSGPGSLIQFLFSDRTLWPMSQMRDSVTAQGNPILPQTYSVRKRNLRKVVCAHESAISGRGNSIPAHLGGWLRLTAYFCICRKKFLTFYLKVGIVIVQENYNGFIYRRPT